MKAGSHSWAVINIVVLPALLVTNKVKLQLYCASMSIYGIRIKTLSCSVFTESLALIGFLNLHLTFQLVYPVQSCLQGPVSTLAREAEECSPDKGTTAGVGSSQVQGHQGKVQALGIKVNFFFSFQKTSIFTSLSTAFCV